MSDNDERSDKRQQQMPACCAMQADEPDGTTNSTRDMHRVSGVRDARHVPASRRAYGSFGATRRLDACSNA